MDFRSFVLQLYRFKQSVDNSPSHEATATYIIITIIIGFVLYILIKPSLSRQYPPAVSISKLDATDRNLTPDDDLEDRSEESIGDVSEPSETERGSLASFSRKENVDSGCESISFQLDSIKNLQKRLEQSEEQLGQARNYLSSVRERLARAEAGEEEKVTRLRADHDSCKRRWEAQIAAAQDQLRQSKKDVEKTKDRLAESEKGIDRLKAREKDLCEQGEELQSHLYRVSNELDCVKGEISRVSNTASESQPQHENCLPRDQVERMLRRRENLALGTNLRILSGASGHQEREAWINKQVDARLIKKEQEFSTLHHKRIKESQDYFDSEYVKLQAVNVWLHTENTELRAALGLQPTGELGQNKKNALKAIVEERDETVNQLAIRISQLQKENTAKDILTTDLTRENSSANEIIAEFDTIKNERTVLRQQLENLTSQVQKEHADKEAIVKTLASEKQLIATLRDKDNFINKEQFARRQQLENLVTQYQTEHAEKDATIAKLNNDNINNQRLQHENLQLKGQLTSKTDTDGQLKQVYDQDINRLTNTIQQLNTELHNLKQVGTPLTTQLRRQIAGLQKEVHQERLERAKAQGRFDDNLKRLVDAKRKIEQLQKPNDKAQVVFPSTSQPQVTKAGFISITALQTKLREQEKRLHDQHRQDLTQQSLTLQNQINDLKTTTSSQTASVTTLNSQIGQLTEEKANLSWFADRKDEQIAAHETTIAELETHLKQSHKRVEGVTIGFETTRTMLEAKLAELEDQLTSGAGGHLAGQQSVRIGRKRDLDTHARDYDIDEEAAATMQQQQQQQLSAPLQRALKPLPAQRTTQRCSTSTSTSTFSAGSTKTKPFASLPLPPASPPQQPPSKRTIAAAGAEDKTSLDWELFEGPLPDLEAIVAQDEEKARKGKEDEDDEMLMRELKRYLEMEE